jgi:hypothetical protein
LKLKLKLIFLVVSWIAVLQSCSDNPSAPVEDPGVLVFSNNGLIDSAWVTCCCQSTKRFFSDTLSFENYSKVRAEFDGATNTDGSQIEIYYHLENYAGGNVFTVRNIDSVNGMQTTIFDKPADKFVIEVRTTVFPPVCGPEELKYTRSRDLKIFGVK